MSKLNENGYFRILEWGHTKVDDGVTFKEYQNFLNRLNTGWGEGRTEAVFRELFSSVDKSLTPTAFENAMRDGGRFHLSVEASFRHLEMIELNEARQSSTTATCIAIGAIIVTALIGLAQIWIAVCDR
jgi:hypothetical protein